MNTRQVLRSQFNAALDMLEHAVRLCPDGMWDDPADRNRFWHVAYHILFYTDLYISEREAAFTPWALHREHHQFFGALPWPPHEPVAIGAPYARDDILDYLAICRDHVHVQLESVDLDSPSGFDWLPMGKFELHLYNLRHIQQHTGELMERLGARAGVDVTWVGMGR